MQPESTNPLAFLCISCEFKGLEFIKSCKQEGNKVFLVTSDSLRDKPWPREFLDDIFFVQPEGHCIWNMGHLISGLAHFMRSQKIDRVIALDDFDVEKASQLREEFRIPGMGQTTSRYFRDKLAMRMRAQKEGISVPAFSPLFNDEEINQYIDTVSPPWVVKPRSEAAAAGIKKVYTPDELWRVIENLGDDRHHYLVEEFKPGDVYHVDSITSEGRIVFARVSQYMDTPFDVAQGGGIFRSHIVEFGSEDDLRLRQLNVEVMKGFGMRYSASHTEFIRCKDDGKFYFLETSSRVGGAHLADMVEASSGINLWSEWARLETAMAKGVSYHLPEVRKDYAGIVVSLARFRHPDTSAFNDPELVWRLDKEYHVGFIVQSPSRERVIELLDDYAIRIARDFHAAGPGRDRITGLEE